MGDSPLDNFGHKITEPCEAMLRGHRCMWPFTFLYRGRWLCRVHIREAHWEKVVRNAKKFLKRQSRS